VSSERNADIQLFDLVLNSATTVANDSVDELLATFSADQRFVAYISMATGSEEIWLAELNSNNRRRLTQFNDGRHYLDLKWSNDGKRLIGLTFNEIHLIDAVTGTYERLNLPQKEIRGISFQTNTQISFSVKEGERWRVYTYDTVSQRVSAEDPMWSFVQFQYDPEDSLWVSRDNRLYAGTEPSLVKDEQISIEKLLFGRQWNLRKRGDNWFWYQPGPVSGIQHYSMQSAQIRTLVTTTTGHFDVSGAKILHSQTEQVNSNLYQTRAVN
jgi:dipeptidyl aminopeptidase/acylaminoacyl peptidase